MLVGLKESYLYEFNLKNLLVSCQFTLREWIAATLEETAGLSITVQLENLHSFTWKFFTQNYHLTFFMKVLFFFSNYVILYFTIIYVILLRVSHDTKTITLFREGFTF